MKKSPMFIILFIGICLIYIILTAVNIHQGKTIVEQDKIIVEQDKIIATQIDYAFTLQETIDAQDSIIAEEKELSGVLYDLAMYHGILQEVE